ncbi:hypothetical protein [Kitasatospora herbaricolor]|uniref:Excreted virulence factor EspC (Type VII ESX diderm) n=1 Tax=Kitasatospora herbaricolor TaxID=68217 RepID=A0ABZ1W0R2_9ACTN|nr:hypothetical protein [Kitasatospora herbaricolor]
MSIEQHPLATAVHEVDRQLRRTAVDPVCRARDQRFRLGDEEYLLAAVAAAVHSLEQLSEGLADQLTGAASRGVLDTAARRLADVSSLLSDGVSRAARAARATV